MQSSLRSLLLLSLVALPNSAQASGAGLLEGPTTNSELPVTLASLAPSDEDGAVEAAIALEFAIRGWALDLIDGVAPAPELKAALASPDWRQRRAALQALDRAGYGLRGAELEDWARQQVQRGLGDAHPNVQVAALIALDALGGPSELASVPWVALGGSKLPAVRLALARLLVHDLASLQAKPVAAWTADQRAHCAAFVELRLGLLLGDAGEGLLFDTDPEVRGAARQTLFIARLPQDLELAEPFDRERIELLDRLVREHEMEQLCVVLRIIARTTPGAGFHGALSTWSEWVATERAADLLAMEILPPHFRGVIEATRLTAGGSGAAELLVPAFADWVLTRADSMLEFDSWRTVDDLFVSGVRAGGDDLLQALMETAVRPDAGLAMGLDSEGRVLGVGDIGEVHRELFQALVESAKPPVVLALAAELCRDDSLAVTLIDQFPSGFDAADLGPAAAWTQIDPLDDAGSVPSVLPLERQKLAYAVVEAIATRHAFQPSLESEAFLLEVMDWENYAPLETAFKALCDARWSGAERSGLHSDSDLIEGVFRGFDRIWRMSKGVRLDLLVKLPRDADLALFAPLVIDVGDIAGYQADYRSQCVELLGSCPRSELAADALARWLDEELEAMGPSGGRLSRAEELELSGFARALAGIGAEASFDPAGTLEDTQVEREQLARAPLEELLALSRSSSDELGKTAVGALAKFKGGLEFLGDQLLQESGPQDRRARIEVGISCLRGGVQVEAARAELFRDYGAMGWDLRDRVIRAIGFSGGSEGLSFLRDVVESGLDEHAGLASHEEMNSAIDVLAWGVALELKAGLTSAALESDAAATLVTLRRVVLDASNIESRGIGLGRLGVLLEQLRISDVLSWATGTESLACLEEMAREDRGLEQLTADEGEYLRGKAVLAFAQAVGKSEQPEWLKRGVLKGPLDVARDDLVERWRGADPGGREFTNRSSVDLWRALGDAAAVLEGEGEGRWFRADGRLLGTMARQVEGEDGELAARLFGGAVVALVGEPVLDREVWLETMGRQLGLAWGAGEWRLASNLAERLVLSRQRGVFSVAGFRAVFGTRSAAAGTWPLARLESLGLQARARAALTAGDRSLAEVLAARAAGLVGHSRVAWLDQQALADALGQQ